MYYTTCNYYICVHDAVEFFFNTYTTHFIQKNSLVIIYFYYDLLHHLIKLFECDLKLYILSETAYIYGHVKRRFTL
jgi:hypothetical protein